MGVNFRYFLFSLFIGLALSGCRLSVKDLKSESSGASEDTSVPAPTAIAIIIENLQVPPAKTYGQGAVLKFNLEFSDPVFVLGNPQIGLLSLGTPIFANYWSGGGTKTLEFRYEIPPGMQDSSGLTLQPLPLKLPPGSEITPVDRSKSVALDFSPPVMQGVLVDTLSPSVIQLSSSPGSWNGFYRQGELIEFNLEFTQAVKVIGSPGPRLALDIGGQSKFAQYLRGNETSTLTFGYTVETGLEDINGVSLVNQQIDFNGGSLLAVETDSLVLPGILIPYDLSQVKVDSKPPTLEGLVGPSAGTYLEGEYLSFMLNFSEPILVAGQPRLAIQIGSELRYADFYQGQATAKLEFRYTVTSADLDRDGIRLATGLLDLNQGALSDPAGNTLLSLNLPSIDLSKVLVGEEPLAPPGGGPAVPPAEPPPAPPPSAPVILQVQGPSPGKYKEGHFLNFVVEFSSPVTVTGNPQLPLLVGDETYLVTYLTGSGASKLIFRYIVGAGVQDHDGPNISANQLILNGGAIQDQSGQVNAYVDLPPTSFSGVVIDSKAPQILVVTAPASGTYSQGDVLDFNIEFSEVVMVVGSPALKLTIGSELKEARFFEGSGSRNLTFKYTVEDGLLDLDGVELMSNLHLDALSSIKDNGDNLAPTQIPFVDMSGVLVNSMMPQITQITASMDGHYKQGDMLFAQVRFSFPVEVSGLPAIKVQIGNAERSLSYQDGTGTSLLTFSYTLQAGDQDTDGLEWVSDEIELLAGASIIGSSGLNAGRSLLPLRPSIAGIFVDTSIPFVHLSWIDEPRLFTAGDFVHMTLMASEQPLEAIGAVKLGIRYWGANQQNNHIQSEFAEASFVATDGAKLIFKWEVPLNLKLVYRIELDTEGLSSGSIEDPAGNELTISPSVQVAAAPGSLGGNHSCSIMKDSKLYCWGANNRGQLGIGSTTTQNSPNLVDGSTQYQFVASGDEHTCGVTDQSQIKCWGYQSSGRLGNGSTRNSNVTSPEIIDVGVLYAYVSTGNTHSCGITIFGELKCWGDNASGQLGDGSTRTRSRPVVIDAGTSYKKVVTGLDFTCGLTLGGDIKCWGENSSRQLGDGSTTDRREPVSIGSGNSFKNIHTSSGNTFACAIDRSDKMYCWGDGSSFQLGQGQNSALGVPTLVDAETSYVGLGLGTQSSCGITSEQGLRCWGLNTSGQLGDGGNANLQVATDVVIGLGVIWSQAGGAHRCSLFSDGHLACTGLGVSGQLGLGSSNSSSSYQLVAPSW